MKIGYFAQHQLELLDLEATPLLHLQRNHPDATEQALRDYLGSFGFIGDRVSEAVAPFSGGEKARLVLAMVVRQRPNLLLLDEPTNHLDLEMRYALTVALQGFEGALVVVSHDRYLLEGVADQFLLVANRRVAPFDGDLDDYATWLRRSEVAEEKVGEGGYSQTTAVSRKEQRRIEAEQRKAEAPLRREVKQLEQQIEKLESQRAALEQRLAEPEIYEAEQKEALKQLLQQKGEIDPELEQLEERLLELYEALG